jgi:hypothetical protein
MISVVTTGTPITPVTVAAPLTQAGGANGGTLYLATLSPGYVLGRKKRSQVGAQTEPPLPELPVVVPIPAGATYFVSIAEVTTGIDPKVGLRTYLLKVQITDVNGRLLHQEEITFDGELSSSTFVSDPQFGGAVGPTIYTPSATKPGYPFQNGSDKQPDLAVRGFFVNNT